MSKQRRRKNVPRPAPVDDDDVQEEVIIPKEILNDICSRFIVSMPNELKKDNIRVCFEVELAFWFFLDNYCDPSVSNVTNKQHRRDFASFCKSMFEHVNFLRSRLPKLNQILIDFRTYKSSIPVMGAIILDKTLNYVLLVQGYYSPKGSWGFPKGKMNEKESAAKCAIREVKEEIGFDIGSRLDPSLKLRRTVNLTPTTLYIITDVDLDTKFEPETECEIRQIQWCSLRDLPNARTDRESAAKFNARPSSFFTVAPFIENVQEFARYEQFVRHQRAHGIQALPSVDYFDFFASNKPHGRTNLPVDSQGSPHLSSAGDPVPSNTGMNTFTGETFMKLFQEKPESLMSQSSQSSGFSSLFPPSPPRNLDLTIQVYSIPGREVEEPSPLGTTAESESVDQSNLDLDALQISTNVHNNVHDVDQSEPPSALPEGIISNTVYETMLKLNQTEELCLSTSEMVLRTPATEGRPVVPGCESMVISKCTGTANSEDFQRTPRSSRSGPRRLKKHGEHNALLGGPFNIEENLKEYTQCETRQPILDQGISINVTQLLGVPSSCTDVLPPVVPETTLTDVSLTTDNSNLLPSTPRSGTDSIQSVTEIGFVPVSPVNPAAPLRVGSQAVSETSAFTLVKPATTTMANSSASTLITPTPIKVANFLRLSTDTTTVSENVNATTENSFYAALEVPKMWTNFKLDTDRLINAFDNSAEECHEETLI